MDEAEGERDAASPLVEQRSKMREKLSKAMDFSGSAKRLDTYVDETP